MIAQKAYQSRLPRHVVVPCVRVAFLSWFFRSVHPSSRLTVNSALEVMNVKVLFAFRLVGKFVPVQGIANVYPKAPEGGLFC